MTAKRDKDYPKNKSTDGKNLKHYLPHYLQFSSSISNQTFISQTLHYNLWGFLETKLFLHLKEF